MSNVTEINAHDIVVARDLKMPTPEMGWLARGLIAAAAKDEVFGVKCHAHLVADGLTGVASSTDGYRIHQLHLNLQAPVDPVDVVIPRAAVANDDGSRDGWVSVIFREWDEETAPSARFDAPLVSTEEYPPLARVLDTARMGVHSEPVPVALDYLADARALQMPETTTPTLEYMAGTGDKPGPVILDFWERGVLRATALIQPTRTEDDE
ncbi:hypothetical protein [Microbacterium karelineae]|uniref:hypothetical protein n=1 Tax=Microbacterium karelineae TaxID=2654283 RepID=UPI0012EADAA8|nr:hypothetical protein [Microbacterium karelineae]